MKTLRHGQHLLLPTEASNTSYADTGISQWHEDEELKALSRPRSNWELYVIGCP